MQTFMDLNDPTLWSLLTASYISRWFVNERVQTKNLEIFCPILNLQNYWTLYERHFLATGGTKVSYKNDHSSGS